MCGRRGWHECLAELGQARSLQRVPDGRGTAPNPQACCDTGRPPRRPRRLACIKAVPPGSIVSMRGSAPRSRSSSAISGEPTLCSADFCVEATPLTSSGSAFRCSRTASKLPSSTLWKKSIERSSTIPRECPDAQFHFPPICEAVLDRADFEGFDERCVRRIQVAEPWNPGKTRVRFLEPVRRFIGQASQIGRVEGDLVAVEAKRHVPDPCGIHT